MSTRNLMIKVETDMIRALILMMDNNLSDLIDEGMRSGGPDEFGYFDSAEHITGLGFVACQMYMTAVYGRLRIPRRRALAMGPKHASGVYVADAIDNAANYWKHNYEWALNKNPDHEERVKEAFESIGFPVELEYPLSGMLTELSDPQIASFAGVIEKLEAWSEALQDSTKEK